MTTDCPFCGYPALRPTGHASWCARVAAWLRQCPLPGASGDGRYAEWESGTAQDRRAS